MTRPFVTTRVVLSPLDASPFPLQHQQPPQQQIRLFSSRRGYDWDPDEDKPKNRNFLERAADKVKSFLPDKWFKSEEEQQASIQRKRRQEEITGTLDQALKDAPLGVRLMGKMAGKVMSKVATGLAATMEESARQMEDLLDEARSRIVADGMASELLGEPITVGPPFSQSSSTSIINGQRSVNIQASFEVVGSRSSGVATMVASELGMQRLRLDVAGRSMEINTSGPAGGSGRVGGQTSFSPGSASKKSRKGEVIDAEIIDAEYTEKK